MNPAEPMRPGTTRALLQRFGLPSWQFSIRELLLLTTAVAALLALAGVCGVYYERSQKFRETAIPNRILEMDQIVTICNELGLPPPSITSVGGKLRDWDGCQDQRELTIQSPPQQRAALMDALCRHVREVVRECEVEKSMNRRRSGANGLNGFNISYQKGTTVGSVTVHSVDESQVVRVSVLVNEHKAVR